MLWDVTFCLKKGSFIIVTNIPCECNEHNNNIGQMEFKGQNMSSIQTNKCTYFLISTALALIFCLTIEINLGECVFCGEKKYQSI